MTNLDAFLPGWQTAPEHLTLPQSEVHVWVASLNQPAPAMSEFVRSLSPDERERMRRFHALRERERYAIAHGVVRDILGRYLRLAPVDVRFCVTPNGKPVLAPALRSHHLEFNLSHSHELALIAVGRGRQLGVDVERIRAEAPGEAIAERFFSPSEVALLRALPPDVRMAVFFAGWTRKEAYSKARGDGLLRPLDQFAVVLAPDQPATLLYDTADPQAASRWSLRALDVGPAYAASLAVEGRDWRLRCWQWPPPTYL